MSGHRRISGRLVIATHNPGKLAEMRELLAPYGIDATSAGELGLPEPDETGMTFRDNARIKAEAAAKATGTGDDRAAFICALTLAWPDGHCESFEGRVEGRLVFPPRGTRGFGYDPIFIAQGWDITFGEMDPAKKHEMSHRADAFRQLVAACFAP